MDTEATLYRLLAWTSPSYPTGAFSYSHGLEWAVDAGSVRDMQGVVDYVSAVLARGGGWIDAVLFARAHEAAQDSASFDAIAELAWAFRGSSETALEARQQGSAFLLVTRRAWPHPQLEALAARPAATCVTQCTALALACAAHGVPLMAGLQAFLHATAANLVSAGLRLVPLGQTDGQIALARLAPVVAHTAEQAARCGLEDLGTQAPGLELCSMRHETQYTRLFRS